jgi:hypothetical protein
MRSYIAPNNKLSMYDRKTGNGVVDFTDTKSHKIRYILKDVFGNTSTLTFWVRSHLPAPAVPPQNKTPKGTLLNCGKINSYTKEGMTIDFPADALYEDLDFICSAFPAVSGSYSSVYHLQNDLVPIHSACTLSIQAEGVPKRLLNKALIVKVGPTGHFSGKSSKLDMDVLKTQVKEFGNYAVAIDTTPPVIRPVNVSQNKNVSKQQNLSFKISDNLSGIQSYRGTLNGKWILMDLDAKSGTLVYAFDERIKPGKNNFRLVVRDAVGNETAYQASLTR